MPDTVATLIDLVLALKKRPVPKVQEVAEGHLAEVTRAEEDVRAALLHYGPVEHRGQLWWAMTPARMGIVNSTPFGGTAEGLPWPPPAEQKVAGFISQQHS